MAYIATTINSMAAQIMSRPEIKQVTDLKGKAIGVTRRGAARIPTIGRGSA